MTYVFDLRLRSQHGGFVYIFVFIFCKITVFCLDQTVFSILYHMLKYFKYFNPFTPSNTTSGPYDVPTLKGL